MHLSENTPRCQSSKSCRFWRGLLVHFTHQPTFCVKLFYITSIIIMDWPHLRLYSLPTTERENSFPYVWHSIRCWGYLIVNWNAACIFIASLQSRAFLPQSLREFKQHNNSVTLDFFGMAYRTKNVFFYKLTDDPFYLSNIWKHTSFKLWNKLDTGFETFVSNFETVFQLSTSW